MSYSLRPTTEGDEDFLWEMLFHASHSNEEPGVEPGDIMANPDLVGYIDGWRDAGCPGVIAESPGGRLGAAWLRLLDAQESANPVYVDERTPELAVSVRPDCEGRGIGSALIRELIDVADGRFPAIVLSVRSENPARRLYRRLGFESVGEIRNRVGTRSVKMILGLSDDTPRR